MSKVRYISADDWFGLYLDDECIAQTHRFSEVDLELLLSRLGVPYDRSLAETELAYDIAASTGGFPQSWSEVEGWESGE